MGKGVKGKDFEDCLKRNKVIKFTAARKLVQRELETAQEDLKVAQESLKRGNDKWATIQAYYAMFHTARALLYSQGYREKSHYCLIVAIKSIFVESGDLDVRFVEAFQTAKVLRENADYENEFSMESARELVEKSEQFLDRAQVILRE
ncbi:MAG: HEPN domain-containing protein [Candidatus Omnitrophica bacterium]|nr:HEPN domain-containing protein [Candidatus Omnitrophota bacterium]